MSWRNGDSDSKGGPAIQDLDHDLGRHWIGGADGISQYIVRHAIVQEYLRLVSFILCADVYPGGGAKDFLASEYAIRVLEERQGTNSLMYLCTTIPNSQTQPTLEKRKRGSQGSRTEEAVTRRGTGTGAEPSVEAAAAAPMNTDTPVDR